MKDKFVILNKIQSHIITWGDPFNCGGSDVIVCITGNPGVTDFYKEFGTHLYEHTRLPVCVVGQAGHEEVPDPQSNELKGQEDLFDLNGQIQHKLDLITKYIDKESKLHLIGHSIGAWLILETLHKNNKMIDRVSSINLLFPTIQRMAESGNGQTMNNIVRKIHGILMFLLFLLNLIPESVIRWLINYYLKFNSIPHHHSNSVVKFFRSKVIEKVLFLAYNEMDTVKDLNIKALQQVKHMTNVLYSVKDGWAPAHYMDSLRQFEPALKMSTVNAEHAFVLKSSPRIAQIVATFIKTKIPA